MKKKYIIMGTAAACVAAAAFFAFGGGGKPKNPKDALIAAVANTVAASRLDMRSLPDASKITAGDYRLTFSAGAAGFSLDETPDDYAPFAEALKMLTFQGKADISPQRMILSGDLSVLLGGAPVIGGTFSLDNGKFALSVPSVIDTPLYVDFNNFADDFRNNAIASALADDNLQYAINNLDLSAPLEFLYKPKSVFTGGGQIFGLIKNLAETLPRDAQVTLETDGDAAEYYQILISQDAANGAIGAAVGALKTLLLEKSAAYGELAENYGASFESQIDELLSGLKLRGDLAAGVYVGEKQIIKKIVITAPGENGSSPAVITVAFSNGENPSERITADIETPGAEYPRVSITNSFAGSGKNRCAHTLTISASSGAGGAEDIYAAYDVIWDEEDSYALTLTARANGRGFAVSLKGRLTEDEGGITFNDGRLTAEGDDSAQIQLKFSYSLAPISGGVVPIADAKNIFDLNILELGSLTAKISDFANAF